MGLICTLVRCPGCGHQVPPAKLKGICDTCVALQTAREDQRPPWADEEDGDTEDDQGGGHG